MNPEHSYASGGVAEGDAPVVAFEDVSLHFDDVPALDHLSFSIKSGETCVVVGEAGSGKTMLLKTAVGLVRPDSGRVYLFAREITKLKESALAEARSRVGILFQEGGLFDSLTIEENVGYPLLNVPGLSRNGGDSSQHIAECVLKSLRFVELEKTLDKFPSELSGGMRRRVGIARAVVTEPELVLYDSPTAGLDPITANRIIHLIIQERDVRNTATIMVTHRYQDGHLMANFRYNPSSGRVEPSDGHHDESHVSTKFLVMRAGKLVFEGSEAELCASADPYVQKFARPGSS